MNFHHIKLLFLLIFFSFIQISYSQEIKLGLPLGNDGRITNHDLSKNGKYLVVSSEDNSVKVFEVLTGFIIHSFTDHSGKVIDVKFIEDDQYILSISEDKSINLYSLKTGILVSTFLSDFVPYLIDTSKNEKHLMVVSQYAGIISVFEILTGKKVSSFNGPKNFYYSAQFSPTGNYIIIGVDDDSDLDDNTVRIYNSFSGEEINIFRGALPAVKPNIVSKDENQMFIIKKDTIHIVDFLTGRQNKFYPLKGGWSYNGALSLDGKYLAVSQNKGEIALFDNKKRKQNGLIKIEGSFPNFIRFSPDGNLLLTYDRDGIVRLFGTEKGTLLKTFKVIVSPSFRDEPVDFSNDGKKIIITSFNNVFVYNSKDFELLNSLKGTEKQQFSSMLSNSGNYLINTYDNGDVELYSTLTGKQQYFFDEHEKKVWNVSINKDEKYLVTNSIEGNYFYNLESGKKEREFERHRFDGYDTRFGFQDSLLIRTSNERTELINLNTGNLVWSKDDYVIFSSNLKNYLKFEAFDIDKQNQLNKNRFEFYSWSDENLLQTITTTYNSYRRFFELSSDGKLFAAGYDDGTVQLFDVNKNEIIFQNNFATKAKSDDSFNSSIINLKISSDNRFLMVLTYGHMLTILDVKKKKILWKKQLVHNRFSRLDPIFSNNNDRLVVNEDGKPIRILSTTTGNTVSILNSDSTNAHYINLSSDDKFLIITSIEGCTNIYELKTGKLLIKQYVIGNEPLWLLPNGYYLGTKDAASKLYYVRGLQTISFEQLDVKYNRPDIVLDALGYITGNKNKTLIKAYKKAWEKRIKKLEIDTTSFQQGFSIPESDFANRDDITFDQNSPGLKLNIKGLDSTYNLDRFNIWINEVPVYGNKGISIVNRNSQTLDTTVTVTLSKGRNKIETSIFNVNGIESYRQPLYVNYTPKQQVKEKLYFVGIGLDRYKSEGHDLNYSVKDIRDLSVRLKEKYGNQIQIQIDTLFNESVNVSSVKKLKERLRNSKVDDKVIVSFSGHGLLSEDLDYYLATYDVNFDRPEQNGLPYDDLEYLLDDIPSRKKLLLIDACHSGEVDKEEVEAIAKVEKEKEGLKGSIAVSSKKSTMGMKNSFELMKELFNNVDRATGATVISAAAGTQFAQERGDLKNGVFTYCILNQLKEKESITLSELKAIVSKQVQEITNGLQQPTSRNETIENDWRVW